MSLTDNYSLSFKESKSEFKVPVVNGVLLHSQYDPVKEARTFIERNKESISTRSKFLIFGLGYGYHIEELHSILQEAYGDNFEVHVIEPVKELYEEVRNNKTKWPLKNVTVWAGTKIEALYANKEFVNFLTCKPAILPHPASFNLHKNYFKDFLSFEANNELLSVTDHIEEKSLKDYLGSFNNSKFDEIFNVVARKPSLADEKDFLLLAYNEINSSL